MKKHSVEEYLKKMHESLISNNKLQLELELAMSDEYGMMRREYSRKLGSAQSCLAQLEGDLIKVKKGYKPAIEPKTCLEEVDEYKRFKPIFEERQINKVLEDLKFNKQSYFTKSTETAEKPILIDTLTDIIQNRATQFVKNVIENTIEQKATNTALDVAQIVNPIKPLNVVFKGIQKLSDAYNKIDKTETVKLVTNVYEDIKKINIQEYQKNDPAYEFIQYIQSYEHYNAMEIEDIDNKIHIAVEMIQEGY